MLETCATCGAKVPANAAGCSCQRSATPSKAIAWGALDFDPTRLRTERSAGSVVARLPQAPAPDLDRSSAHELLAADPAKSAPSKATNTSAERIQTPARGVRAESRPLGDMKRSASPPAQAAPDARSRVARPAELKPRAESRPLSQAINRAGHGQPANSQGESAPLHPALRGAKQAAARPRSGPLTRAAAPARTGAASAALDVDAGWSGLGDPFGSNSLDAGPMPELVDLPAVPEPAPVAAPQVDPAVLRGRKIAALSRYGLAPQTLWQTVPYCLHVIGRKRVLRDQLASQVKARQQLELAAEQAQCALGEALFAKQGDSKLAPMASQLRAVRTAHESIGSSMEAGKRMVETRRREFAVLSAQVDQRRLIARPSEQRALEAEQRLSVGKARVRALEERLRAIEAEQKSLKSATGPQTLARIEELEAQRQAVWGDIQSLNVELLPLTEDHTRLQSELAEHNAALAELAAQQARLVDAAERDQGRQKLATGGAQSAHRAALASLAQAALRENLGELAPDAAQKLTTAQAPIPAAREQESLLRAASESYDYAAYNRGIQLLAGACIGTFTLFLILLAR